MNIAWLLIGAAIGWIIHYLIDSWFWSDKRVCTDEEIRLRERVGSLEGENKTLQGKVGEFDAERAEWNTRFTNQEGEIKNYKAKISDHESESMALSKQIKTHESEISGLKGKLDASESANADLKGRVGGLEADLKAAKKAPNVSTAAVAGGATVAAGAAAAAASSKKASAESAPVEGDDLQKLWGIGPASEKVLNDNGIHTYAQLCKQDPADIRKMLDDSGGTFNLVREDTWPEQACMADAERWPELDSMQEELSADYVNQTVTTEFTGTPDELTKLWGIGPAVEKVLHSKGVYKFDQLAGMPLKMLGGIITAAGPRFSLVKPELWIPQAKVAATGDWDALDTLKAKISAENKR